MAEQKSAQTNQNRCKVFIVDHDAEMLDMLKFIVEEDHGCAVEGQLTCDNCPDLVQEIKHFQPDLVILDFIHEQRGVSWGLLDQLRTDKETSSIPVLAMSTSETVVEQTLVSYNVRSVLTKPFDLKDLGKAIAEIRAQPKVTIPPVPKRPGAEARGQAADVLEEEAPAIVRDWLRASYEIEPFKSQQRLRPVQLVNHLPVLLWGTAVALRTGEAARLFEQQGIFHQAAVTHAAARNERGVPLGALVKEYKLLRNAIWQKLQEKASEEGWTAADVFRIGEGVHRALDEVVEIAVESYGQAAAREAT